MNEDEGVSGQTDVPAKTQDAITRPANASTAQGTLWAAFNPRGYNPRHSKSWGLSPRKSSGIRSI